MTEEPCQEEREEVRRRSALLTGAVLGPLCLALVTFFAHLVAVGGVSRSSTRASLSLRELTSPSIFVAAALCLSSLAGIVIMGGWRGAAAMCTVVGIAGLAALGTALSPFAPGGDLGPTLAALAAATLTGAALIRPRP